MTVFYRGRCALITHEVFVTYCPVYRAFLIRDLSDVCVTIRAAEASRPERPQIRAGSAGLAGATALAAAAGWPVLDASALPPAGTVALAVTLVVVAASSTAFAACLRARPSRVYELWAVYRGKPVCLFTCRDQRTFGQVKRGLVRAIERIDDG